jgi:hypothetical protein
MALWPLERRGRSLPGNCCFSFLRRGWRWLLRKCGKNLLNGCGGRWVNRSRLNRNRGSCRRRSSHGRGRCGNRDGRIRGRRDRRCDRRGNRRRSRTRNRARNRSSRHRRCNRCNRRLDHHRGLLHRARLLFAGRRRNPRLHHYGDRRRNHHRRSCNGHRAGRRFGHHRARRRPRCDSRSGRGGGDNGRRASRLRENLACFRTARRHGRRMCRNYGHSRRRRPWRRGYRRFGGRARRRLCTHRRMALPRLLFFLLLVGQNGLQYVAGFGYMREIDLRRNTLRSA